MGGDSNSRAGKGFIASCFCPQRKEKDEEDLEITHQERFKIYETINLNQILLRDFESFSLPLLFSSRKLLVFASMTSDIVSYLLCFAHFSHLQEL